MAKVIFHIDLNSYFASAEIIRNPELAGLPVVVSGLSKRSVVCTSSYEARFFGVHAAMPIQEAYNKCPELIVVEGDFDYYKALSKCFFDFVRTFSNKVEIASIDECYVDMSETIKTYKRPLDLAWELQQQLKRTLHLSCSIGIGPNKFLAKMASDQYKPMGIYVIRKQDVPMKLWPLPVGSMMGIGKKSAPKLLENGIETIGDLLLEENYQSVLHVCGKQTYKILQHAKGQGSDTLHFSHTLQSISQSTTIANDIEDYSEICTLFRSLSQSLSQRAISKQLVGKLISISIRYHDFRNVVRSTSLDEYTDNDKLIYEQALSLFDENGQSIPIRHLGITLGSLYSKQHQIKQLDFFEPEVSNKIDLVDMLNNELKTGGTPLVYASELLHKAKGE